jgi:large subunit ribosomal protein L32
MECPNCSETKLMHHACPACGQYRGRQIVDRKETA